MQKPDTIREGKRGTSPLDMYSPSTGRNSPRENTASRQASVQKTSRGR